MKRLRALLPLLVLVALGIAALASGALDRFRPETLAAEQAVMQGHIVAHPVLAALLHITVMSLAIATGIPGAIVLIFAGGMLFGIVQGTVLSTIALTIGAVILFYASRAAFGDHTGTQAPALVERLRGGYLAHPVSYTFFLRLVPFFPFGGVTVALAWLRCPTWLFVLATAGGGAVMTAIETALGAGLAETIAEHGKVDLGILTTPQVIVPMIALALISLVPVAIGRLRKAAAARRNAVLPP